MIRLTRLNGGVMHLSADLVALVEAHHDTVVTLLDGKTYVVLETAEQVVDLVRDFRASVLAAAEELRVGRAPEPAARLVVLRPEGAADPATTAGAGTSGTGR